MATSDCNLKSSTVRKSNSSFGGRANFGRQCVSGGRRGRTAPGMGGLDVRGARRVTRAAGGTLRSRAPPRRGREESDFHAGNAIVTARAVSTRARSTTVSVDLATGRVHPPATSHCCTCRSYTSIAVTHIIFASDSKNFQTKLSSCNCLLSYIDRLV